MSADPVILKILTGVQAGVEVALADGTYLLGTGPDDDIQLVDISLVPGHARLRIGAGKVELATGAGSVQLASGEALTSDGGWRALEPLEIATVGTTRLALAPRSANWATVGDDGLRDQPAAARAEAPAPPPVRRARALALPAFALALTALLAVWFLATGGRLPSSGVDHRHDLQAVRAALDAFPFGDPVAARQEVDGAIYVSGYVDTPVQRRALAGALERTDVDLHLRLFVLEDMRREIEALVSAEKLTITFAVSDRGEVTLDGLVLRPAVERKFAAEVADTVSGVSGVTSHIRTADTLLESVRQIVAAAQLKPWLLLRLDDGVIEVSGALPNDKVDAWVGFLQTYASRFAAEIPLRSFVQLQSPNGALTPAPGASRFPGATGALALGPGQAGAGDTAVDVDRLRRGDFKLGDVFVAPAAAGHDRAPAASTAAQVPSGREAPLRRAAADAAATRTPAVPGPVAAQAMASAAPPPSVGPRPVGTPPIPAPLPAAPTGALPPAAGGAGTLRVDPDERSVGTAPIPTALAAVTGGTGAPRADPGVQMGAVAPVAGPPLPTAGRVAPAEGSPTLGHGGSTVVVAPVAVAERPLPRLAVARAERAEGGEAPASAPAGARPPAAMAAAAAPEPANAAPPRSSDESPPGAAARTARADLDPGAGGLAAAAVLRTVPDQLTAGSPAGSGAAAGALARQAAEALAHFRDGKPGEDGAGQALDQALALLGSPANGVMSGTRGPKVPDWYLPLFVDPARLRAGEAPCWDGTGLAGPDVLPVLFWLDVLSASRFVSLASFDKAQQALLVEAALDPRELEACGRRTPAGAKAVDHSLYLREVSRNPGFAAFVTRDLPAAELDVAGASLGRRRFVITRSGARMGEGAAPDRGSRLAIVGELGVALQREDGLSVLLFGPDITWTVAN